MGVERQGAMAGPAGAPPLLPYSPPRSEKGEDRMHLTPPKKIVFYITTLAIIVGAVLFLFTDSSDLGFWITFAGGALLTISVSMKGI